MSYVMTGRPPEDGNDPDHWHEALCFTGGSIPPLTIESHRDSASDIVVYDPLEFDTLMQDSNIEDLLPYVPIINDPLVGETYVRIYYDLCAWVSPYEALLRVIRTYTEMSSIDRN